MLKTRKSVYFVAEGAEECGVDGGLCFFTKKEAMKEAHRLLRNLRREYEDFEHSHNRYAKLAAHSYYDRYVVTDRYIVNKCEIAGMTAERAYKRVVEILREGDDYIEEEEIFYEEVVN